MTDDEEVKRKFDQWEQESLESTERWIERMGLDENQAERYRDHSKHWILIDDEPVAVPLLEWGLWMQDPLRRIIAQDYVQAPGGRMFWVSTVFLGLDHSFSLGPRLLFETMIFDKGGEAGKQSKRWENYQVRYTTKIQAEVGHNMAMEAVRTGIDWTEEDD